VRVLITGASGQLGGALQRTAPAWAEVNAIDADDCDLTDVPMLRARLTVEAPDVILNAAA
jgi:dTDP-4-dehydrorhamnose reductase